MEKLIVKVKSEMLRGEDGSYTILETTSSGGAIISDMCPFEAMKKFKEATQLAYFIRSLVETTNHRSSGKFYVPEFE